jgi:hypothetical protein
MNLSEYMLLSREQRIGHVNLSSPCDCPGIRRESAMEKARKKLLKHLHLTKDIPGYNAQCCHLCDCHSRSGSVCVNPDHLYFGTASENQLDQDPDVRKNRARKMLTAALAMRTPEYLQEWKNLVDKARMEKTTTEDRRNAGKRGSEKVTADVRSERSRKGWETRKKNQET